MKKTRRLQRAAALSCAMLCTAAFVGSIGKGLTALAYASISDVEFWGAYSSEKVIKDNTTMYDDIKKDAKIDVTAIGGEEEAAQIIMTAKNKAVKEYDVVLSDLKTASGETFKKENIKVYHELYIQLGTASEYYRTAGYYPDALAPFEGVKKRKETGFKANTNQGLYVSFDVPEAQQAGLYTGTMQIVIAGESKNIPITLEVANGSIGAETHAASSFLNEWYFYRGELDTTEEMYEKYNQALFDYRLGCNNVIVDSEDVEFYAETVCRYAKQPECPGYNIPWASKNYKNSGYVLNGRQLNFQHSYDVDKMQLYLRTIAYKGLEENVDPFKKAFIYGWDEPDLGFGVETAKIAVKEWSYIVKQCKIIVADELRADASIENQELLEEILVSLENVPHLVLSSTFLNNGLDLTVEDAVYCPEFQHLQSDGARDTYRLEEGNDLWWYGCVNPDYPYPTYHIDDTVLSARLESWMKADYNIQGNLYWSTCLYSEPGGLDGLVIYPEDFYSGNAARSLGTNGEGFLFYPGKKYGVDGPIPSLRLEHIRDGLEEYEMIYKMAEIYGSKGEGYSEDAIMRYIYDTMYSGTKISTTSENFEIQRARLIDLFELANSDANVCITSVKEGAGGYDFEVYANEGYTVKQAGTALTTKRDVNGGSVYSFTLNVADGQELDLSVDVNGKTYGVKMGFGSSSTNYTAEYFKTNNVIQTRRVEVTTELVNAVNVIGGEVSTEEKWLKLSFAEATAAAQDFLIVDDNVLKNLSVDGDKLVIRFFRPRRLQEPIKASLLIEYGNSLGSYTKYVDFEIKAGYTVVSINNLSGFRWSDLKYINKLRITLGQKGDEARTDLYFVDMSVYKK